MPSELFELVERTGTIYDADDVALAAGFIAIDDDNAPAPENVVHPNELINNLFENEWGHSGICYRRLTGASNCNPRLSSFPTQLKPTVFKLFELFFYSNILPTILRSTISYSDITNMSKSSVIQSKSFGF